MNDNNKKISCRLTEHYNILLKKGYNVLYLALQGSQNYNLDEYTETYCSDIDTKAIVLPSFRDFCYNKTPISTTLILDNNEHIDVKDIRIMFEMFKKNNLSYLELLYTKYSIVSKEYEEEVNELLNNRDKLVNKARLFKTIAGMSMEKKKALCHPYPNLLEKIEKYGFDGKQLSHCVRLNEMLSRMLFCNEELQDVYKTNKREELMNYKKQLVKDGSRIMTKEEAIELCEFYDAATKKLKDAYLEGHLDEEKQPYQYNLNELIYKILKKKFREEIERDEKRN